MFSLQIIKFSNIFSFLVSIIFTFFSCVSFSNKLLCVCIMFTLKKKLIAIYFLFDLFQQIKICQNSSLIDRACQRTIHYKWEIKKAISSTLLIKKRFYESHESSNGGEQIKKHCKHLEFSKSFVVSECNHV